MIEYETIAREARRKVLDLVFKAQASHIGSNFSAIELMAVLFKHADVAKDEVILSAGWKAAAWYYFLHQKSIVTEEELNSFCQPNSPFIGLVEPMNRWGLRCAGGSMGLGLAFAVGFALAKKLKNEEGTIYCLMSDGEQQCGTTWESYLIAEHHHLNNLVVITDGNKLQAMGKVEDILPIKELLDEEIIDGHDFQQIETALNRIRQGPTWIYAHTTKGKGVSFMENSNEWHYRHLDKETYDLATAELR
jgi:transketolase